MAAKGRGDGVCRLLPYSVAVTQPMLVGAAAVGLVRGVLWQLRWRCLQDACRFGAARTQMRPLQLPRGVSVERLCAWQACQCELLETERFAVRV